MRTIRSPRAESLSGAVHFAGDAHGDCRRFTERLAATCATKYGVVFKYDAAVIALERDPDTRGIAAVQTSAMTWTTFIAVYPHITSRAFTKHRHLPQRVVYRTLLDASC